MCHLCDLYCRATLSVLRYVVVVMVLYIGRGVGDGHHDVGSVMSTRMKDISQQYKFAFCVG